MNYYSTTFQSSSHNYAPLPGVSGTISTQLQHPVPPRLGAQVYTNISDHIVNTTVAPTTSGTPPPSAPLLEQQLISNGLTLPKPELLKFNGDPMDYIRFINNFETNISRMYLVQYCIFKTVKAVLRRLYKIWLY